MSLWGKLKIKKEDKSFSLYLSVAYFLLCLAAFLFLIFISLLSVRYAQKEVIKIINHKTNEDDLSLVTEISESLKLEINNINDKLNLASLHREIAFSSPARCQEEIVAFNDAQENKIQNLSRINPSGIIDCSVNPDLIGLTADQFFDYNLFRLTQKPYLGKISQCPKRDKYFMALAVPLFDSKGTFAGSLTGFIFPEDLIIKKTELLSRIYNRGGYFFLADDDGDVLYHPQRDIIGRNFWQDDYLRSQSSEDLAYLAEDINLGISGSREYLYEGAQKIAFYNSFEIYPERYWGLVLSFPNDYRLLDLGEDKSMLPFRMQLVFLFSAFIVSFFLLLFYGLFQIIKPVKQILKELENIYYNQSERRIDGYLDQRKDEIGRLARLINSLMEKNRNVKKEVEKEVFNRTKEIEKINNYMVGRELKMLELKEELARLKKLEQQDKK